MSLALIKYEDAGGGVHGVPGPGENGVHHAQRPSLESLKRQRGADKCGADAMVCLFCFCFFGSMFF